MDDETPEAELAALVGEIAQVEQLGLDDALARALSLMPWLAPYAEAWSRTVLARAAAVARPIGELTELAA